MTQLLIPVLPVAAPGVRAKRNREAFLERMMMVATDLESPYGEFSTAEMTSAMQLAIPAMSRLGRAMAFRRVAMGLRELERRGALVGSREPWFGSPRGFWSTAKARGRPRHRRRPGRML